MNVMKNMEAIFTATIAVAFSASIVIGTLSDDESYETSAAMSSSQAPVAQVLQTSAKRMTAAEKQQSLLEESKTAGGNATEGSRI